MADLNLLLEWLTLARGQLEAAGYECRIQDRDQSRTCTAVDLDGCRFVGTVVHWPPDQFEFQFNSCGSGEVVALEAANFSNTAGLQGYVENLLRQIDGLD